MIYLILFGIVATLALGIAYKWDWKAMGLGAVTAVTAIWHWFGDVFGSVTPPTP